MSSSKVTKFSSGAQTSDPGPDFFSCLPEAVAGRIVCACDLRLCLQACRRFARCVALHARQVGLVASPRASSDDVERCLLRLKPRPAVTRFSVSTFRCFDGLMGRDSLPTWVETLRYLDVSDVDLKYTQVLPLCAVVRAAPHLATLRANYCRLRQQGSQMLFNALDVHNSVWQLHVVGNGVAAQGAQALGELLGRGTVRTLDLSDNQLLRVDLDALQRGLLAGGSLQSLTICATSIWHGSAISLSTTLRQLPLLTTLRADHFTNSPGCLDEFVGNLPTTLTVLGLSNCSGGVENLARGLETTLGSLPLKLLDVSHNPLTANGMVLVSRGLLQMGPGTLESLDVTGCLLGDRGLSSLLQTIYRFTGLRRLALDQNRAPNFADVCTSTHVATWTTEQFRTTLHHLSLGGLALCAPEVANLLPRISLLRHLRVLDLSEITVDRTLERQLSVCVASLSRLEWLSFARCRELDVASVVEQLGKAGEDSALRSLILETTYLDDERFARMLLHVRGLRALEYLDVSGNLLRGLSVDTLCVLERDLPLKLRIFATRDWMTCARFVALQSCLGARLVEEALPLAAQPGR